MDRKLKRSMEKSLPSDKAANSVTGNEESDQACKLLTENAHSKDGIAKSQVKITQEAIAGWETAKREAISLKKDLDKVLHEKAASDERLCQMEATLKDCMQQLHFVRQDQEKRIHSAVIKTSENFDKTQVALNEKLVDTGKRIAKLVAENTQFHRALSGKDKVISDLSKHRTQVEADLSSLKSRVESSEKENASLKYEILVLQKELDIRNEEAEVNRRAAENAQKQQKESSKKIGKLESECQRLRLLVQRRLPGPAALTRMRNEVEVLVKDQADTPRKRISFLTEQLLRMEEENRSLHYALNSKTIKGQTDHFQTTLSDLGSDDKASCAESSSALISEIENFKNERELGTPCNRYVGINSEMDLMDDFAEMEKLAIVSLDYPAASSRHSSEEGNAVIDVDKDNEKNEQKLKSSMSIPIFKILELLEGIHQSTQDNGTAAASFSGYMVRVFQWKNDELNTVLQQILLTCNELLNGKADLEQFVQRVASTLEWVMNHCFSIQDVSSMKDSIRGRLDWDEGRSESGEDSGSCNHSVESNRLNIQTEKVLNTPKASPLDRHTTERHRQSKKEEADSVNGDQTEESKTTKEGMKSQAIETNPEQEEACKKIPRADDKLENGNNYFERHEETCNGQKRKEGQEDGKPIQALLRNEWEITAASEKLAECQETLLNLGKQLKALASPMDAELFEKLVSTPADHVITSTPPPRKITSKRLSLQDKMQEEDNQINGSPTSTPDPSGTDHEADATAVVSKAIIPVKKNESRSFLKKLFLWKKKGNRKKAPFS